MQLEEVNKMNRRCVPYHLASPQTSSTTSARQYTHIYEGKNSKHYINETTYYNQVNTKPVYPGKSDSQQTEQSSGDYISMMAAVVCFLCMCYITSLMTYSTKENNGRKKITSSKNSFLIYVKFWIQFQVACSFIWASVFLIFRRVMPSLSVKYVTAASVTCAIIAYYVCCGSVMIAILAGFINYKLFSKLCSIKDDCWERWYRARYTLGIWKYEYAFYYRIFNWIFYTVIIFLTLISAYSIF